MINVLIIDDDAMVAELNRRYVAQIPGFQCCGTASTLEKAKEIIFNSDTPIDLILLDIYMQKENGLDLLPVLHNARCKSDVIVISLRCRCSNHQRFAALRCCGLPDQTLPGFPL
ncbi:hypothetical protein EIMP300_89110 [Escherichia coli]|uniref:Response regulatory domain-containing protein n=1 Tax=Escherichia coli TaxID=562 RepID=A0A8S0G5G4_ECOLX|nr:hypothetical protein EIMP300_89110 [Escherichia coli]